MGHRHLIRSIGELFRRALALAGGRVRFRVRGASMSPALEPDDEVLVDARAYRHSLPRPGDLVLARHPFRVGVTMVKRVAEVSPEGRCSLAGDNPEESTDSRILGAVPLESILGRVVARIR